MTGYPHTFWEFTGMIWDRDAWGWFFLFARVYFLPTRKSGVGLFAPSRFRNLAGVEAHLPLPLPFLAPPARRYARSASSRANSGVLCACAETKDGVKAHSSSATPIEDGRSNGWQFKRL